MSNLLRKQNKMIDMTPPSDAYDVTYGNSTVGDALDKLQIKSVTFNDTTSSNGRIVNKFVNMDVFVLSANCYGQSHLVIPYKYEYNDVKNTGFKILNSENMAAIVNTSVQLEVYYIEQ